MKIPCYLEYDEESETVTIRHAKTGVHVMQIKLEAGSAATMSRVPIDGGSDSDNFWIGIKPADSVVFNDKLFYPRHHLVVQDIKFSISK